MAEISKITLPSGTTYDIKDATARASIADIEAAIAGGMTVIGETTSDISDGSVLDVIVINGENHRALKGELVWHESAEFLWDGDKWIEIGDLSAIGALGYKDNASATYTPAGLVSAPSFTGISLSSSGVFTPEGFIEVSIGDGDANYTPSGTITQPTFSGSELTSTGSYTPTGTVTVSVGSGDVNYTPAGTITKPAISITPSTDSVYSITDVGTLPELTATVFNENLTLGFSRGTLPTKGSAQMVLNGASAELVSAPAFSGTGVDLEASFGGTTAMLSVTGTPAGTVTQPIFNGTSVELIGSFEGAQGSIVVTGTPEGTITAPEFLGTTATITVT